MADMLRAAKVKPAFLVAADIHLVEIGPRLQEIQKTTLARSGLAAFAHVRESRRRCVRHVPLPLVSDLTAR